MEINTGIYSGNIEAVSLSSDARSKPDRMDDDISENEKATATASQESADTVKIADDISEQDGKVRGVIRLLQAGHFKGVADVRLRINFNNEITALQNEKMAQALEDGVADIVATIASEVESFLETEGIDEEISVLISEASVSLYTHLESVASEYSSSESGHAGAPIEQLQSAFDDFVTAIQPADATDTDIEPGQGTDDSPTIEVETGAVETEGGSEGILTPQQLVEQFIASLIDIFTLKLENLETILSTTSVLPELSQPSGNGKAYDKFLSIYNGLNSTAEAESGPDTIDETV